MPIAFSSSADQTTVAALIEEVYRHLEPSSFGKLNRLTADIDNVQDTLVVDFATGEAIREHSQICVDVEVMYVWEYDKATRTVTVQRGMGGSVPSAHTAGALVQVQPRVAAFDVLTQLQNEVRSWPPALYRVGRATLTFTANSRAYNLASTTGMYRVLEVRGLSTASGTPRTLGGWRVDFNADTSVYPTGKAIVFSAAYSGTAEVIFAAPFVTTSWSPTMTLASVGLSDSMLDIPVLGAVARLLHEAPRTDTRVQGQSRDAEEVPPMHTANLRAQMRRERDDRIHQEMARLRELYPQRRA